MKYCTNCGNENYNNICRSCGVKINQTHRYCGWCAEELSFDDKVCPYCNTKIKPGILSNVLGVIAFLMIPVALFFILDIDVMDKDGAVSRCELGLDARKCLICDEDAKVCARSQKHSMEELLAKVKELCYDEANI